MAIPVVLVELVALASLALHLRSMAAGTLGTLMIGSVAGIRV